MNKSKVNLKELFEFGEKGQLYYDKIGPSQAHCDYCGKMGWSFLVGCGRPEEMEGHLQNADPGYIFGARCFYIVMKLSGAQYKKFDWEKFGDSGTYFK